MSWPGQFHNSAFLHCKYFAQSQAQLNQKAGELRANNRNLTTQIQNLISQQRALNGMWEGDARQDANRMLLIYMFLHFLFLRF
mgnify:CR=1 FL=1